jgi:uncharacterized spore protein YtfJ
MIQPTGDAGVLNAVRQAYDNTTAARVFGTPVVQDDVILLPVAKIQGGGGGGGGQTGEGQPADGTEGSRGSGGGFGVSAKPMGAFVLKNGNVTWHPAVDVNRIVLGGQLVAVAALLLARAIVRMRTRDRAHRKPR